MSSSTPPSGRAPKQLSSRLMTMKFMQRGAASSPASSSGSPSDRGAPLPKRQKTEGSPSGTHRSGPSSGTRTPKYPTAPSYLPPGGTEGALPGESSPSSIDWRRKARDAAYAEETRRQEALDRVGMRSSGETKWTLITDAQGSDEQMGNGEVAANGGLRIVRYDEDDDASEHELGNGIADQPWREDDSAGGRMRFGKWKAEQSSANDMVSQSQREDHEDSNSSRSPSPDNTLSRRASSAKDSPSHTGKAVPDRRANAGISTGGGISSGGGVGGGRQPMAKTCYRCGQTGHIKSDCPRK